jgi:hypothetical protein
MLRVAFLQFPGIEPEKPVRGLSRLGGSEIGRSRVMVWCLLACGAYTFFSGLPGIRLLLRLLYWLLWFWKCLDYVGGIHVDACCLL